jgi:hypothetical protein
MIPNTLFLRSAHDSRFRSIAIITGRSRKAYKNFELRKLALHLSIPHQDRWCVLVYCEPYPKASSGILRAQRHNCDTLECWWRECQKQLGGGPCRPMKPCVYHPFIFLRLRFSSFDSPTALSDDDIHISHRAVKWLVRALTLSQNSMIMLRGAPGVGATKVEGSIGLSFIGIFVEGAQSVQIPEDAMVPDGVAAAVKARRAIKSRGT